MADRSVRIASNQNTESLAIDSYQREKNLWTRVLIRAIIDACHERLIRRPDHVAKFGSAFGWLTNNRDSGPGSVLWICREYDISFLPRLRTAILRASPEQLKRIIKEIR